MNNEKVKNKAEADAWSYFHGLFAAGDCWFYRDRENYYGRAVWEAALEKVNPANKTKSTTLRELRSFTMDQCVFDLLTANGGVLESDVELSEAFAWAELRGASMVQIRVDVELNEDE